MGNLRLYGSTSGYVEIAPPAVGNNAVLTLPTDSIKSGLVLVNETTFSTASTVSINNCFSSTYQNYKIMATFNGNTSDIYLYMRMRASGTDASDNAYYYSYNGLQATNSGAALAGYANPTTSGILVNRVGNQGGQYSNTSMDIFRPNIADATSLNMNVWTAANTFTGGWAGSGMHTTATQYDGFTFHSNGAGTITGTLKVYGYRNSL